MQASGAHQFSFEAIDGSPLPLDRFQGKALLVVNTASKCGFTPQYKGLEALWASYRERGLVVLGVPSNDFGGQEPAPEDQIRQFCEINYGVDFPLTAKTRVIGDDAHPLFRWLRREGGAMARPRWNFYKFLIAPDGRYVDWFSPVTTPSSGRLKSRIEAVLPKAS